MPGKAFPSLVSNNGGTTPHRRAEARLRLHIPARLILLTGVQHCMLEDLSVTGAALIPQDGLPHVGVSGIVQCESLEAFGTIRWARYGRCGVMFEDRLPLANVIALRHFADAYEQNERENFRERARAWVQGGTRHM
ncbi:MAG: PilZ domain-containing protein [Novosphingobium sp.]|nr:PilZ domain-containing protein [Novosphingobium sp.]